MREGAQILPTPIARPRRSALYLPASNPRAIEKARSLACDVVILDLEDAVAPDAKAEARAMAVEATKAGGFGARELVIRVNGLDTPWGADDLAAVSEARPDALLIPKVSVPADFAPYARSGTRLWAMIETCAAVFALDALGRASAQNQVDVWVIGTNDLAKEMRCRPGPDRAPLQPALALGVMAARAHGLSILDGVWNDIADLEGLARECAQGSDLGFDGKTVIHPSHLAATNSAFSPDPEAVAWARTVAAAFDLPENAGKGVIKVEGRMVERLHLDAARRLLTVAGAIAAHEV
jgi:citrate lyase subunit beta/citryl-CoA lyase